MRRLIGLLLIAFASRAEAFPQRTPTATIDLGQPGALEALARDNPAHYDKVVEIMRIAGDVSCETLPQMLKTQYDAKSTRCTTALVYTSYPAKRWLHFQLDDTAYQTYVVLDKVRGKLTPTR